MTQSRLVTRSLFHVACSNSARERPWISGAAHLVADALQADRDPVVLGDVGVLDQDLAGLLVHLDVGDHADLARRERAEAEAAAGHDVAGLLDSSSRPSASSRPPCVDGVEHRQPARPERRRRPSMFSRRNAIGSMFRRVRELVDDLLAREVRLRRVRRPEGAALERAARRAAASSPAPAACVPVVVDRAVGRGRAAGRRDRRPRGRAEQLLRRVDRCARPGRSSSSRQPTILPFASIAHLHVVHGAPGRSCPSRAGPSASTAGAPACRSSATMIAACSAAWPCWPPPYDRALVPDHADLVRRSG